MKTVTAKEAKTNFDDLLVSAQSEPVSIIRNGKEQGVLLSSKDFEKVKQFALQAAITKGMDSGSAGILDMQDIKQEAKRRARENAESFSAEESDRLYRILNVIGSATELFEGNQEAAIGWLRTHNKGLENKRPIEMISTTVGYENVLNIIGRLEHGFTA